MNKEGGTTNDGMKVARTERWLWVGQLGGCGWETGLVPDDKEGRCVLDKAPVPVSDVLPKPNDGMSECRNG